MALKIPKSTLAYMAMICALLCAPVSKAATPSCQDLRTFYKSQLAQDFQFNPDLSEMDCQAKEMKTVEAFYFLFQISNHSSYFWVRERIKTIQFAEAYISQDESTNVTLSRNDSSGVEHKVNLALASANQKGDLTVFDHFAQLLVRHNPERSLVRRVGVLIHEARHMDKDDPGHVICAKGPLAGTLSCDPTNQLNDTGGAYVYEALFWEDYLKSTSTLISKALVRPELQFILSAHLPKN